MSLRAVLAGWITLVGVLGLAACGDDSTGGGGTQPTAPTATAPVATAPSATEPPRDATPTNPPGGAEHTAREDENRAQQPVGTDAQYVLRGGRLRPPTVTVPSFIAVQLSVVNLDPAAHVVVVRADRAYRLSLGRGRRATTQVPGQRAGSYPVLVDGRRRGALVFGGEPGP